MNNRIYESSAFLVTAISYKAAPIGYHKNGRAITQGERVGYEIVDVPGCRITFIEGAIAEEFTKLQWQWHTDTPEQATVEQVLGMLVEVAPQPLVQH